VVAVSLSFEPLKYFAGTKNNTNLQQKLNKNPIILLAKIKSYLYGCKNNFLVFVIIYNYSLTDMNLNPQNKDIYTC